VDKGKAEVDQFMRIQKINGEISEIQKAIAGLKEQIQAATKQAGEKAIALAKTGELTLPDLKAFADQIDGFEKEIAAQEAEIADKKKAIEAIKAEDEAKEAAPATEPPAVPPIPAASTPAAPAAPAAARFCSACGASLAGAGAFCPQCGAKQA
jgi:seryl-tRNA synthetase